MNRRVRVNLALRSRGLHFLTSELEVAAVVSSSVCEDSEDNSAHFGAEDDAFACTFRGR